MTVKRFNPIYKDDHLFISNSGSAVVPSMQLDFPESGGVSLKQVGEKKLYEIIQSNKINCDLENVLRACVHSNQLVSTTQAALNDIISDFTGVTNMAELYAGTKRLENTWSELPLEVRESFDSDIKKFIRGIGTDSFADKVSSGFSKYSEKLVGNGLVGTIPPSSPTPDVNSGSSSSPTPDVNSGSSSSPTPDVVLPNLKVEV